MSFLTLLYGQTIKSEFKCAKAKVTRTSTINVPEDQSIKKCEVAYDNTGLQAIALYTQNNKLNLGDSFSSEKSAKLDLLNSSWSVIGFVGKYTDFKVVELNGYLAPQLIDTLNIKSKSPKKLFLRNTDPKIIEDWIAIQDMFDAYKGSVKSLSR